MGNGARYREGPSGPLFLFGVSKPLASLVRIGSSLSEKTIEEL